MIKNAQATSKYMIMRSILWYLQHAKEPYNVHSAQHQRLSLEMEASLNPLHLRRQEFPFQEQTEPELHVHRLGPMTWSMHLYQKENLQS